MSFPQRAQIFTDLDELLFQLMIDGFSKTIILTSGGMAPPHSGHISCIQESARLVPDSTLIVVVNGNGWLERKKGFVVMDEMERAEIVAAISGVDYVLIWDDGSPTVSNVIRKLKPNIFTKGGDRNSLENIPENSICQEVGCQVIFGVGKDKVQSSSNIIERIKEQIKVEGSLEVG